MKTDEHRWLGKSIIKNLKYKAFQKGIIVTSVRPYHISDSCSECGAKIRKYNEGHTAGLKLWHKVISLSERTPWKHCQKYSKQTVEGIKERNQFQ